MRTTEVAENTLTGCRPDPLSYTGRENIPTKPKFKQNSKKAPAHTQEQVMPPRHCDAFSTSLQAKAPAYLYQNAWLHEQAATPGWTRNPVISEHKHFS